MSYPTVLAPWFVVFRIFYSVMDDSGFHRVYYSVNEEDNPVWTELPKNAMLFMSLHSATRIAQAEGTGAEIRALASKNDLAEFRPREDQT